MNEDIDTQTPVKITCDISLFFIFFLNTFSKNTQPTL